MLTFLLVALWLPTSSHVLLEDFGTIHEQHGHCSDFSPDDSDEHDSSNHDAADGFCLLASFEVKVSASSSELVSPLNALLKLDGMGMEVGMATQPAPEHPGTAPPELSRRWQFSSRAALPVRAPSFVF